VLIPSRQEWEEKGEKLPGDGEVWYTDGSRIEERSGAGYYCRSNGRGTFITLGSFATVFQSEVMAILGYAQRLEELRSSEKELCICSDSQAALMVLTTQKTTSKLVWECKLALQRSTVGNSVRLLWVPGHTGIRGNEIADRLALLGARSEVEGPEPHVGLSKCWARTIIREWIDAEHCEWWDSTRGCRQAKDMMGSGPTKDWKDGVMKGNRRNARLLVQIITGHGHLGYHRWKMRLQEDYRCRWCGMEPETVIHILTACPRYLQLRLKWFGDRVPPLESIRDINSGRLLGFWREGKLPE